MMKKYVFFLLIIVNSLCSMQNIKNASDVDSFAGKFVAYKTGLHYFGKEDGFPILNENKYGYVRPDLSNWNGEKGYCLSQLLKPNEIPGVKALINEFFAEDDFHIREMTSEEKRLILSAIKEKKAKFEYDFSSNSMAKILQNQIEK